MKRRICFVASLAIIVSALTAGTSFGAAWKFAYMSDNKDASAPGGINLAAVGRIAADMAAQGAALVLVGGDLIDGRGCNPLNCGADTATLGLNGQYNAWIGAMAPVYGAGIPVYTVPGNHEYWSDTEDSAFTAWQDTMAPRLPAGRTDNADFPGMEYSFSFNNAFFIGLNQNKFEPGPTQPTYYRQNDMDWISGQLAARNAVTQPHVIAFGHMPQFMPQYTWTDADKANREAFWDALGTAGAKMYFTGHTHTYARGTATTANGRYAIQQLIVGSSGAGFEKDRGGTSWSWNGIYKEDARVTPANPPTGFRDNMYEGYALVTIDDLNVTIQWRYYDPSANVFLVGDTSGYTFTPPTSVTSATPGVTITSYNLSNRAPSGPPTPYNVDTVVGFTATGVPAAGAKFSVTYTSLPANTVFYKIAASGNWKQLYPDNQCTGMSDIKLVGTTLSYNMQTSSDCNSSAVPGTITDPLVAGSPVAMAGSSGGSTCFIATACFGSSFHPYVAILESFRDAVLLRYAPGRFFVAWYYRVSPPIADAIRTSESMKMITRVMILPAVGFSYACLKIGLFPTLIAFLLCTGVLFAGIRRLCLVKRRSAR